MDSPDGSIPRAYTTGTTLLGALSEMYCGSVICPFGFRSGGGGGGGTPYFARDRPAGLGASDDITFLPVFGSFPLRA